MFQSLISLQKWEINRRREGHHCLQQIVYRERGVGEIENENRKREGERDREREEENRKIEREKKRRVFKI